MARRPTAETAEDKALREVDTEDTAALEKLAREAGPPADADRLSERDEDDIWEIADLNVDRDALAQRLAVEGLPPEEIKALLVVKLRPEWGQVFARPTQSMELADQYARMAQFPYRWSLLEDVDDPDEQVAKAERLDRRYQKRVTAMQEQATTLPEPTMRGYGAPEPEMGG